MDKIVIYLEMLNAHIFAPFLDPKISQSAYFNVAYPWNDLFFHHNYFPINWAYENVNIQTLYEGNPMYNVCKCTKQDTENEEEISSGEWWSVNKRINIYIYNILVV